METTLTSFVLPIVSLGTMFSGLLVLFWGLISRKQSGSDGKLERLLDTVANLVDETSREISAAQEDIRKLSADPSKSSFSLAPITNRIARTILTQKDAIADLVEIRAEFSRPASKARIQRLIDKMLKVNSHTESILDMIHQIEQPDDRFKREGEATDG